MNTLYLIFKEILHRKINFFFSILATVTAVTLFVSFFTTGQASKRETTRLMRDIGFNLRIIPRETDMSKFWNVGFSEHTMPEDYVSRFADRGDMSYNHLIATLQERITWRGMQVILTGIAPEEITPPGKAQRPMTFTMEPKNAYTIDRGTVYVGYELANILGPQDQIQIMGKSFRIARRRPETGSDEDIRIYAHLKDVQELLNKEKRVNEIKALECLCLDENKDSLDILREELEQLLPEAKVIQIRSIAKAREKQRLMISSHFSLIMPIMLIVCAAWIGVLAMMNVRERQNEIGVMRALGYGSGKISILFLGKALIIGFLGAGIGFAVGTWFALQYGPDIFEITAKSIKPLYNILGWSLIAAPVFAAVSSFIPAMVAVTQDPANTLRD
ncbi:FtsX-like permease family protein [Candidatus Poribacteria bacterium]|nr:FtsX-like permease family protein [Candidatus Poribacteria bacterium]